MTIDQKLLNVVLVGIAFMLIFTAFQTWGNIQATIVNSIKLEDKGFSGDGYISLSIIYGAMAISNWAMPSLISCLGPNWTMIIGAFTYLLFLLLFFISLTWLLYLGSVILGIGAAAIWTGQGNYLTLNSTKTTISRNSSIFWSLLQVSMFAGNLFVYLLFRGVKRIDRKLRFIVTGTLSATCALGIIVLFFLRKPRRDENDPDAPMEAEQNAVASFKGAGKLFITPNMLLLLFPFAYIGLELCFFSGVYSTCLGATEMFVNAKELVGLSGIFIGIGEVIAGVLFGILGAKTKWMKRSVVVILGFVLHITAFALIFLNLPNKSPFGDTHEKAIIASSEVLAIFCALLLGFGDACYNTQIYSMLGAVYANISAAAFAIFKFSQCVAAAIAFFYSTELILYGQLGILGLFAVLGTAAFLWVDVRVEKEAAKTTS